MLKSDFSILKFVIENRAIGYVDLLNKLNSKQLSSIAVDAKVKKLCSDGLLRASNRIPTAYDTIVATDTGIRLYYDEIEIRKTARADFWKNHFVKFMFGFISGVLVGVVTTILVI